MNFGVVITGGAVSWQIFQQNEDGFSPIWLQGEYYLAHLSRELPLKISPVPTVPAVVKARIVREDTGEAVIPWCNCTIPQEGRWEILFSRVPAGGLYRIETSMEYEGWDGLSCTRGDMIHFIGVGDVFVIAGQSNAAGRAKNPVDDQPELEVHVLRANARWELASHPLGETTGAVYTGHYENHNPGHSPWLHFAKRLRRELRYPIGLVPCAYGGAPLRWWNLEENGALTRNMLDILTNHRIHPKAVLWYQGEAEGYENSAATYAVRFAVFVKQIRQALHQPDLPFFTVQLNRCAESATEEMDRQWGMVRQAQRQAMHMIPNVCVLPAADLALYDFIHNSAESNLVVGERCAQAALAVCYGRDVEWMAPEPDVIRMLEPNTLEIHFSCIRNWLNCFGLPAELLPFDAEDDRGLVHPCSYTEDVRTLTLTFPRPLTGMVRLHGGWRMNPGLTVPCDCMRMPMLSFYGEPVQPADNKEDAL